MEPPFDSMSLRATLARINLLPHMVPPPSSWGLPRRHRLRRRLLAKTQIREIESHRLAHQTKCSKLITKNCHKNKPHLLQS